MRTSYLTLVLLVLCAFQSFSQDDFPVLPKNELGFNANALVSNILPFESNEPENSIENLLFFKTGNGETMFRTSLNFNIQNSSEGNFTTTNANYLLKLGVEKKTRLSKSWMFNSGVEVFGSVFKSNVESIDPFFGEFSSTTTRARLGADWFYGVQWVINDRFAFGTEGYIFLSFLDEKTVQEPSFNPSSSDSAIDIGISLPRSILFSIYF